MKSKKILLLIFAVIVSLMIPFTGCSRDDDDELPADYGSYGADFAREFAASNPSRRAYSEGERAAGQMIKEEFEALGYDVYEQDFVGSGGTSTNYVIRIEGKGFLHVGEDGQAEDVRRIAVIGAHYDNAFLPQYLAGSGYDGISDNASGVGCLMTCAKQIANYSDLAFDVYIVAFGANSDNFAGARAFYSSLSEEEKASLEVMYDFESIYAGDKMYASSGYNSFIPGQRYAMRRKLYQVYDVAYDSELASRNGYSLLYNESGISADINGDGQMEIYSEVSAHKSDYLVFDEANVAIVYFDSCDYFFDTIEEMRETKNLHLQTYDGAIRGTLLDGTSTLDPVLNTDGTDRLMVRINNTAYVTLESMMKGSDYAMTTQQYNDYLNSVNQEAQQSLRSATDNQTRLQ